MKDAFCFVYVFSRNQLMIFILVWWFKFCLFLVHCKAYEKMSFERDLGHFSDMSKHSNDYEMLNELFSSIFQIVNCPCSSF